MLIPLLAVNEAPTCTSAQPAVVKAYCFVPVIVELELVTNVAESVAYCAVPNLAVTSFQPALAAVNVLIVDVTDLGA